LPGFEKQRSGRLQQRLLDVGARVEKTDRDWTDRVLDVCKQLLDFDFLPRIDVEGMNCKSFRAQFLDQGCRFRRVAPRNADFIAADGEAAGNRGTDRIS